MTREINDVNVVPSGVVSVRPLLADDGLQVLRVRIDPEPMPEATAALIRLLTHRSAEHVLTLLDEQAIFASTPYEPEIVLAELDSGSGYLRAEETLPENATVMDVGAHVGLFSTSVTRRFPDARVIAVEPFGPSYRALTKNLAWQRDRPGGATAVRAAVAATSGVAGVAGCRAGSMLASTHDGADGRTLHRTREELAGALPRLLARGPWDADLARWAVGSSLEWLFGVTRETVPRTTVSQLIDANDVRRIAFLKVDVEGHEPEVLDGIRAEHWPLIDAVAVETDRSTLAPVREALRERGLVPVVSKAAFTSGTFARDCFVVRARRGTASRRPTRPVARPARAPGAVGHIAELYGHLGRLARRHWPTGHVLLDVYAEPSTGPVSHPWTERGFRLGLSHGASWARYLVKTYAPSAGDADIPARLTAVFGGDWSTAAAALERWPADAVVSARLAADQLVHRAVRMTFDAGGRTDARSGPDIGPAAAPVRHR